MQVRSVTDTLLPVYHRVYFDALPIETLADCSLIGDDGIERSVIVPPIVGTDPEDDDVRARRNCGIQAAEDPLRRVAAYALVRHGDLVTSSPQRGFQLTRAFFRDATFSGRAWFESATFNGEADFSRATFSAAGFASTIFNGVSSFVSATFSGFTFFHKVRFKNTAYFMQAKFKEPVTFEGSIFRQAAYFDDVDSAAAFSLSNATFKQVPGFDGATFKGQLRLDDLATPHYPWLGYTFDKEATAHFRELRRRAIEAQDRDRELEFFAQEVRTGRFHANGLPSWVPKVWSWRFWFGLGFGAFSDFGRSVWRPLLSWLALTVLRAAFFLGEYDDMRKKRAALAPAGIVSTLAAYAATTRDALAHPPTCRVEGEPFDSTDAVTEAIQLSLKNALVFDVGRTDSGRRTLGCLYGLAQEQDGAPVPSRVSIASTLQALASGLLIFLFLLAVRNVLRLQ